jgi:hypothetical protein
VKKGHSLATAGETRNQGHTESRENGKKPSEQKKKGKPKKTEKRQHTEQKPEREHEPNKDYTERGIAFTIAFVPVDNKKTRKQAGGKEEEKLGREGRVKEKQNRGEKAVALLLG